MIYLGTALILLIVGWLIKYKKATWLISGYNTASKAKKNEYDVEKLTKAMGNFMFVFCGIFLVMAVVSLLFPEKADGITIIGFVVVTVALIGGVLYLNTGNRVKKQ